MNVSGRSASVGGFVLPVALACGLTAAVPQERPAAEFRLAGGAAARGATVELPFFVRGNSDIQAFSWSLDFDEEVVEAVETRQVFQRADGAEWDFYQSLFSNANATPGNGGIDEGFWIGAGVFDFREPPVPLPPAGTDNEILRFVFRVRPEAPLGLTEIAFIDGARFPNRAPVENVCTLRNQTAELEVDVAAIAVSGLLEIIAPRPGRFLRGDCNDDGAVDISDAISTLGALFLGHEDPGCDDACDSNDDGAVNISDPIATLGVLFLGQGSIPLPGPRECGVDPTDDPAGCVTYAQCP